MKSPYIIYRGKVTGISQPSDDGQVRRVIYVAPFLSSGAGDIKQPAHPPSPQPTTLLGGGMLTVPEIGQECIVAESPTDRVILSYVNPYGINPYGSQIPDYVGQGDTLFKTSGIDPVEMRLTKQGIARFYGGEFSQIQIDAQEQEYLLKARTALTSTMAHRHVHTYSRDTKDAGSTLSYFARKENLGFSDITYEAEDGADQLYPPVGGEVYRYVDKMVQKTGAASPTGAPFYFDTRQGVNALTPQDKNVLNVLSVGYQRQNDRFGPGSMLEWRGKKNITGQVESNVLKIGKSDNSEVFKLFLGSGLNKNVPFGTTVFNPLGKGRGYEYDATAEDGFIYDVTIRDDSSEFYSQIIRNTPQIGNNGKFLSKVTHSSDSYKNSLLEADGNIFSEIWDKDGLKIQLKGSDFNETLELGKNLVKLRNSDGAHLDMQGNVVKFGNESVDVIDEIIKMLELIIIAPTPGYGAPLANSGEFGPILAKLQKLK